MQRIKAILFDKLKETKQTVTQTFTENPLTTAIKNDDLKSVKEQLKTITMEEMQADKTSLCTAIQRQSEKNKPNPEITQELLKHRFNPLVQYKGKAPLHFAAECQTKTILRMLLQIKDPHVDVDQLTSTGETALHITAQKANVCNTLFLINDYQADMRILTSEGKTFLEIFYEHAKGRNFEILIEGIAEKLFDKNTPLLSFLFEKLLDEKEDKKENKSLKEVLNAIAEKCPDHFYKQFKRLEENLAAKAAVSENKEHDLQRQRNLCEFMLEIPFIQKLNVKFHNKIFKSTLDEQVSQRIATIRQQLSALSFESTNDMKK